MCVLQMYVQHVVACSLYAESDVMQVEGSVDSAVFRSSNCQVCCRPALGQIVGAPRILKHEVCVDNSLPQATTLKAQLVVIVAHEQTSIELLQLGVQCLHMFFPTPNGTQSLDLTV